jgi:hypothetical protein
VTVSTLWIVAAESHAEPSFATQLENQGLLRLTNLQCRRMKWATTSGTQTSLTLPFVSTQPLAQGWPRDAHCFRIS